MNFLVYIGAPTEICYTNAHIQTSDNLISDYSATASDMPQLPTLKTMYIPVLLLPHLESVCYGRLFIPLM